MASTPITPVSCTPATATWTIIGSAVAASKVQVADVRVTNVHASASANAKLRATNGTLTVNLCGQRTVPFGTSDSTQDLIYKFVLPVGWYFEAWASAGTNLEFTKSGWEDDL